ncbi:MAG: hypothetical protein IT311_07280 [Anaerolineales bacterium]|nr:hypothetical protein [Anaerolineales bacterium]
MTLAEWARIRKEERQRREREEQKAENQRRRRDQLEAQQQAARQQQAKHNQAYRAGEQVSMSTKNDSRIPLFFSSHFRREFSEDLPNGVTIPPLSSTQNSNLKNWNIAAQVATYGITATAGALTGLILTKNPSIAALGAVGGVMWGAYEANCIASVQEEFDKAYSQSGSVQVWREGWKFNVYGGGDSYTVANGPLSASYVAVTTYLLTGKVP